MKCKKVWGLLRTKLTAEAPHSRGGLFFMAKKVKYKYRSAITGRFVSEKYANKHPKTTIRIKCK